MSASEEWYRTELERMTAKMEFQARRAENAEAENKRLVTLLEETEQVKSLKAENARLREKNKRAVFGCCEECRALAELEAENARLRVCGTCRRYRKCKYVEVYDACDLWKPYWEEP